MGGKIKMIKKLLIFIMCVFLTLAIICLNIARLESQKAVVVSQPVQEDKEPTHRFLIEEKEHGGLVGQVDYTGNGWLVDEHGNRLKLSPPPSVYGEKIVEVHPVYQRSFSVRYGNDTIVLYGTDGLPFHEGRWEPDVPTDVSMDKGE
jgi:hypothetical protein